MKLDFDKITDRRRTLSYKWAIPEGELPMWIADMDFEAPEEVKSAIISVANEGIYGYSSTPKELFLAVAGFFERRHGVKIDPGHMVYSNGAIAAVASMVRSFSSVGDQVLLMSPVYNNFWSAVGANGRLAVSSCLINDGGRYSIDFEDLEAKLAEEKTKVMILCNPHNPIGRIWTREELSLIAELCHKHGVIVISDEVHCDFVKPGLHYTPFYAASELAASISCTVVSASKTFNMAGVQTGIVIASDDGLRERVERGLLAEELGEPSVFASRAMIAAFTECDYWVDALVDYVFENRRVAYDYIKENIPEINPVDAEASYLLWVDVSAVMADSAEFCKRLRELTGLYISAGTPFGECARGYVRINLATQRSRVLDGMARLREGVKRILEEKN